MEVKNIGAIKTDDVPTTSSANPWQVLWVNVTDGVAKTLCPADCPVKGVKCLFYFG